MVFNVSARLILMEPALVKNRHGELYGRKKNQGGKFQFCNARCLTTDHKILGHIEVVQTFILELWYQSG